MNDPDKIKILLIEDNPGDAELFTEMLEEIDLLKPQVDCAARLTEAEQLMDSNGYELVFLDLGLPDSSGLETVSRFKKTTPDYPFIALTGLDDESTGLDAIRMGAQDYLVKGQIDSKTLARIVHYALERHQIQKRLSHLNRVLKAIRNVNKLIVQEKDERLLIQKTCDLLYETRGYNGIWIVLQDENGKIKRFAQAGWSEKIASFEKKLNQNFIPACNKRVLDSGEKILLLDPRRDCNECDLSGSYGTNNAVIAVLDHNEKIFGFLAVCFPGEMEFDEEEKSLLLEVTGDIGFALHNIEQEHQREMYYQIVSSSTEAMALVNPDHVYLESNLSYQVISTGMGGSITGKKVKDIVGEQFYQEAIKPNLDECFQGKEARFEGYRDVPGVGKKYLDAVFTPCYAKDGSVSAAAVVIRDKSDLKKSEEALRESEEMYRRLMNTVSVGVLTADEYENISFTNPAAEELFGNPEGGLPGRNLNEFLSPEHQKLIKQQTRLRKIGKRTEYEIEITSASGETRQVVVTANAILDSNGKYTGSLGVFRDVTELRKIEEQYKQSQKMEIFGKFAAGISHDFNNLLMVIGGNTALASMALYDDDPIKNQLEGVQEACDKATRLTRQLLTFSRKEKMQAKIININDMISGLKKMLPRLITEDIKIEYSLDESLSPVKFDESYMEQILMNLFVNAKDAIHSGGVITISTKNLGLEEEDVKYIPGAKPGNYAQMCVRDTGCGMSEEIKSKIFEPFFTTKPEGMGTGLGLATVYDIVNRAKGFLEVESELEKGTEFKIYIPSTSEKVKKSVKADESKQNLFGKETVLVVEDEEGVRRIAVKTLRSFGYNVIEAENGGIAYLKCKKTSNPIDLVITDVIMPEMNGKELVDNIREIVPDIKVLFMSGYTFDIVSKQGITVSEENFVAKPFTPLEFIKTVRKCLDEKN